MPFLAKITTILLMLISVSPSSLAKDWQFRNLSVINTAGENLLISADAIYIPSLDDEVKNISYKCKNNNQVYPVHQCTDGSIELEFQENILKFNINSELDFLRNHYVFDLSNQDNTLLFHYDSKLESILGIEMKNISAENLFKSLPTSSVSDEFKSISANISSQLELDFSNNIQLNGQYQFEGFSWESEDGNNVLADCSFVGQVYIQIDNDKIIIDSNTDLLNGEALFGDIYLAFAKQGIQLSNQITFDSSLNVDDFQSNITIPDAVSLGFYSTDFTFNNFEIDYEIKKLEKFYNVFLKSYMEILGVKSLRIEGQSNGRVEFTNGWPESFHAEIIETYIAMERKKVEGNNLNGTLYWQRNNSSHRSILRWDDLLLAGMPIKTSEIGFVANDENIILDENTVIPVFDGNIVINRLKLEKIFNPLISIDFDGEVEPISLELITEKMGWPIMKGSISGNIPGLKKVENTITFDGLLELQAFDGEITVANLSMERLFGIAPVIAADVNFKDLNLQKITSTFDFGEITGLVKGYVNGLRITNWKPDRLEAYVESVGSKKIKQTISQRAIDNISSIGGIQGAVSRSFLRFFDSFRYKRLGIGCKLRNSICEMTGLKNSKTDDNRYYLIEGSGIPAINILGFRKFIDWEVFLDRLLKANY